MSLQVFVDNTLQLNIAGAFPDGRLGFYNFSQDTVRYSAFTIDPAPTPTPEPATIALMGFGLIGIGFTKKRRS